MASLWIYNYALKPGIHQSETRGKSIEKILDSTGSRLLAADVASFRVWSRSRATIVGTGTTRHGERFTFGVHTHPYGAWDL